MMGRDDLVQFWATSVKQYLRAIEPLLRSEEVQDSQYYYQHLPIVDYQVIPEDGKTPVRSPDGQIREENIRWSYICDPKNKCPERGHDLLGRGFSAPNPQKVQLKGIKSLLGRDSVVREWRVPLNPQEPSFRQEVAMPTWQKPLQREWLEKAVSEADKFLHESGLGLDIDPGSREAGGDYSDIDEIDDL